MINQAHVEAICSATYLQNYLDCMDSLPDELQRIFTRIREVDVKLTELEKDSTPFDEVFVKLQDEKAVDSKFVNRLQRMLIKMQELEDEKIQLSNILLEFIENRSKLLDADRENLDPANHVINDGPSNKAINSTGKKNGSSEAKNSSNVQSSASTQSVNSHKDSAKQAEHKPPLHSTKKRKQRTVEPQATTKSNSTTCRTTYNSSQTVNSTSSAANSNKDEPPAKKQAVSSSVHDDSKPASRLPAKRKRRSRIGAHTKASSKDVVKEPSPEPEEPLYCLCSQISYGEMIGCDNDVCPIEWFHFNCVNLNNKPKGKWYCPKCRGDKPTVMRRGADKIK